MNWRKSSISTSNGENCVEVARTPTDQIAARDSKQPTGPHLRFSRNEWRALLDELKADRYNLR